MIHPEGEEHYHSELGFLVKTIGNKEARELKLAKKNPCKRRGRARTQRTVERSNFNKASPGKES